MFTLERLTEALSFSLGGNTHLHFGLVDTVPGIMDTFQTSGNPALPPLCKIPVVQTSLSCVRYEEKTGTLLRVAPVLWSPVSKHWIKTNNGLLRTNKDFKKYSSLCSYLGGNRSLSPQGCNPVKDIIYNTNKLIPATQSEISGFWLMVISWFSLG